MYLHGVCMYLIVGMPSETMEICFEGSDVVGSPSRFLNLPDGLKKIVKLVRIFFILCCRQDIFLPTP